MQHFVFQGDLAVRNGPRCIVEVLSSVPKCKKTRMFPREKMCVRKLHPGLSYSATWPQVQG